MHLVTVVVLTDGASEKELGFLFPHGKHAAKRF